jgi:hypothetical protein
VCPFWGGKGLLFLIVFFSLEEETAFSVKNENWYQIKNKSKPNIFYPAPLDPETASEQVASPSHPPPSSSSINFITYTYNY